MSSLYPPAAPIMRAQGDQLRPHWVLGDVTQKPEVGLKDLAGAVVRIADALDRAVFVMEETAVRMNVVHPDDVGPSPTAQKVAEG